MNEDVLLNLHDVMWTNLRCKNAPELWEKRVMKILPCVLLLQIWIHARKRRRHLSRLSIESRTASLIIRRRITGYVGRNRTNNTMMAVRMARLMVRHRISQPRCGVARTAEESLRDDAAVDNGCSAMSGS